MSKTRSDQINDLVTTLNRVRRSTPNEYHIRLLRYKDMRDGGDGGPWRHGAETSLRDLHYKKWKDEDFQTVLEQLGETTVLSEEERAERFQHERGGFWSKVKKVFGG